MSRKLLQIGKMVRDLEKTAPYLSRCCQYASIFALQVLPCHGDTAFSRPGAMRPFRGDSLTAI